MNAFHRGNRVVIEVSDDGKGLDVDKIRSKAIANGLIQAEESDKLTEQQAFQLIWEPGFSTAEQVTEVSGRGMGMDIVRSRIESLNGSIELTSVKGQGTTITIKLPLTMAILPSLLTVIDQVVYAIPVESISEIVRTPLDELNSVHGMRTARVRGRIISVVRLDDLLRFPRQKEWDEGADVTLVVVSCDGDELGLVVEDLLGEEDIVIKSLAENYRNIEGLSGASILGNGEVSLILDVAALLYLAGNEPHRNTN